MVGSRLYVGNLKYEVTSEQLSELFAGFGEVRNATVIAGKGFGFVEMTNAAEADNARNFLNGQVFLGRELRIDEAKPRQMRAAF